ncbi:MAG: hypothetical protein VW124_13660, partial [Paracoccaceae bacterium]
YKLYDYINLGKPILALRRNLEIDCLLSGTSSHCCDPNDFEAIAEFLGHVLSEKVPTNAKKMANFKNKLFRKNFLELMS